MKFEELLNSPIHIQIIEFFDQNPASIDTPRGVAAWINSDRETVKKALTELVELNILIEYRATATTGYGYTSNQAILKKIKKYLSNIKK